MQGVLRSLTCGDYMHSDDVTQCPDLLARYRCARDWWAGGEALGHVLWVVTVLLGRVEEQVQRTVEVPQELVVLTPEVTLTVVAHVWVVSVSCAVTVDQFCTRRVAGATWDTLEVISQQHLAVRTRESVQ